ncbi:Internal alternative NAD(P)H-ubiquinone oxidoreductase A1, mitochondrial [Datura stramonium]|uniref:Internal alternative NAD(P)H-ubiquinone oxidoreductase A1, mitochondrial n=1 Tax=Datura stramonium TaxID=4076 RepID=A0ABS8W3L8_DATST|nr:Internal alternative NAD(P)H-ubiquinone oxidoreductase A1, mitochondrial [Datura stramonium]
MDPVLDLISRLHTCFFSMELPCHTFSYSLLFCCLIVFIICLVAYMMMNFHVVSSLPFQFEHVSNNCYFYCISYSVLISFLDPVTINFSFQSGVRLVRGVVKDVQPDKIILSDGTDVPYGLLVWSTGVGPSPFVNTLDLPKARGR